MTRPPLSPKSIVLDDNGRFVYFETDVSDYPFWWTCRDCEITYQETLAVMNERNDGESACPSCKVLAGLCVASGCREQSCAVCRCECGAHVHLCAAHGAHASVEGHCGRPVRVVEEAR